MARFGRSQPFKPIYGLPKWLITVLTTKTITAVSRISAITSKLQTGLARITAKTTQTQTGKSRVQITSQGWAGKALSFDGSTSKITATTNFNSVTNNFFMAAWITPNLPQTDGMIMYNGNDTAGWGMAIGIGSGGSSGSRLEGLAGTVAWINPGSALNLTNGVRQHVAMIRRANTWEFYLNGVQTITAITTAPLTPTSTRASVGMELNTSNVASRFYSGVIDQAICGATAPTAQQMSDLYNFNIIPPGSTISVDYELDEGSGSSATDSSGNSNTGTIVNGTYVNGLINLMGRARITATTSQNQTGKARITATTSKTQTGVARVTATTSKTQTGLARITVTTSQIQTGKARITITTSQTTTGKARIQISTSQTQTGKARVTATTSQTITGKSRVTVTTTKTITGVSRIQITSSQTQTGKSRVQISTSKIQTGLSRITATATKNQTGLARITKTVSKTQTGLGRIAVTNQKNQTGVAKVIMPIVVTTRNISGTASIILPKWYIQLIPNWYTQLSHLWETPNIVNWWKQSRIT